MTMSVDIGTRRELFVDGFLIESMRGGRLQLARPERREIVFEADAPWEDFAFAGRRLRLNYSTSAAGAVQVEVQDVTGHPLPGLGLDEMAPMFGDELDAAVVWRKGSDLGRIAGRAVRLRFVLRDADLYALRLAEDE